MKANQSQTDGYLPDNVLTLPLALAHYLLEGVHFFARQLSELGAIDLPPLVWPAADAGHVQTTATLYLAAELEAARLVPAVESLAGLFASGGLRLEGDAATRLYEFWQGRRERFSREERTAIFARLFGHPSDTRLAVSESRNGNFEGDLAALAEAIVQAQPDPVFRSRLVSYAALAVTAGRLVNSLVSRGGGITAFAASDILKTIEQSLAILKLRPVQVSMGAISIWTTVQAVARRYLNEDINVSAHVHRGRSGMLMLTWVAEMVPKLDPVLPESGPLAPQHPIYNAALAWLQATRDLQERLRAGQAARSLPFPPSGALAPAQM